jgi:phosphoribosylaminoimidazolecarboxamide formyltransferase / IMP cyclohydrolase
MNSPQPTALISVSNRDGLKDLAAALVEAGFRLLSTGGTARALEESGFPVESLSAYTGFPEMLDGRVKSLHPKIFAGLLARRDDPRHLSELSAAGIAPIDLVAVNLYPFPGSEEEAGEEVPLESIDIGGAALLRAGAKNFASVTVLSDPARYPEVIAELRSPGGVSLPTRRKLAAEAFRLTARYDRAVAAAFGGGGGGSLPAALVEAFPDRRPLRYGENHHQRAEFYFSAPAAGGSSLAAARQLQGKQLSYNNLLDLESALALVLELGGPAAVIVKHNNPCGAAEEKTLLASYLRARATDPDSAFGSIVAFNREVDGATAAEVASAFVEAVIAPAFTPEAQAAFSRKKNLRLLETGTLSPRPPHLSFRSVYGGVLVQEADLILWDPDRLQPAAGPAASPELLEELAFAWAVCKHTRSNAIVLGKGRATVGIGAGQMSRIDAARLAFEKADRAGLETEKTVLASDAFFPFRDVVDLAAEQGVRAIVQPGGSIRDGESIAAAEEHGITLLFTSIRHFRH